MFVSYRVASALRREAAAVPTEAVDLFGLTENVLRTDVICCRETGKEPWDFRSVSYPMASAL
jgi:hypothetical protein